MSETPRSDTREIIQIRRKMMGALLADARASAGKSVEECAQTLDLSEADYTAFEKGAAGPTLPQLEVLAYLFKVPIEHFWGNQTVAASRNEDAVKAAVPQFTALRNKVIGGTLRAMRDEAGTLLEELADQTNIPVDSLRAYESGNEAAPVHDLETIARALNASVEDLVEVHGAVGSWIRRQSEFDRFAELPDDMRDFILKPINRSYLDLALRLSTLSVERLRGIAEGILDITF